MNKFKSQLVLMVTLLISFYHAYAIAETKSSLQKKTYIVHTDQSTIPATPTDQFQWYASSLKSVSDSADMLYTYNKVINGFSATLTDDEAKSLQGQPGILYVQEDVKYELHTTHTPEFLGLGKDELLITKSQTASDVVVGVLDTGVWPELKSFDDTGFGPVPSTWKGECEVGNNFSSSSCNNKLIGARFYSKGYEAVFGPVDETVESKSPRDDDGHGTHTSTTVAGSAVANATFFGFATGTARGMATHARVAVYKVCWRGGCFSSDIIAAMDKAVEDGVNVLSLSLGGPSVPYYSDSIAIGAFGAMSQGVLVSSSAGNSGPDENSLSNTAPWITTVGAGTLDRDFPAYITLGNGKKFTGESLYSGKPLSDSLVPLVYAGDVSNTTIGIYCANGTLVPEKVAGKIVVCDRGYNSRTQKGLVVEEAGGVGLILVDPDSFLDVGVADAHFIPSSAVGYITGDVIKKYISSTSNPTATIKSGGTQLDGQPSPMVATFSSRGPNTISPEILKPDLLAPGVNILAGWSGETGPTGLDADKRRVKFNIISGTSMSCPHVSGLAALVKAAHPEWSPAAIRSALMTTAYSTYKNGGTIKDISTGKQSTPFAFGAGHVNPVSALDPGLVYDATVEDYLDFLCAANYSATEIKLISKRDFKCELGKKYSARDLNYPSFAVPLQTASGKGGGSGALSVEKYTRTLTNVGTPATYKVSVSSKDQAVKILVEPESLSFSKLNEKKNFTVTFTASSMPSGSNSSAHLEWSDGKHIVRSAIAYTWT